MASPSLLHAKLASDCKTPNGFVVALLNEVADEDAVVVTALDTLPFCCHADLSLMTYEDLVRTARVFNTRLPVALHINTRLPGMHIRSTIEALVGLRVVGSTACAVTSPPNNTRPHSGPEPSGSSHRAATEDPADIWPIPEEYEESRNSATAYSSSQPTRGTVIVRDVCGSLPHSPWMKKRKVGVDLLSINWSSDTAGAVATRPRGLQRRVIGAGHGR